MITVHSLLIDVVRTAQDKILPNQKQLFFDEILDITTLLQESAAESLKTSWDHDQIFKDKLIAHFSALEKDKILLFDRSIQAIILCVSLMIADVFLASDSHPVVNNMFSLERDFIERPFDMIREQLSKKQDVVQKIAKNIPAYTSLLTMLQHTNKLLNELLSSHHA